MPTGEPHDRGDGRRHREALQAEGRLDSRHRGQRGASEARRGLHGPGGLAQEDPGPDR